MATPARPPQTFAARAGLVALAALLASWAGARAQEAAPAAGARYEVEVIVFRHLDTRGTTAEGAPAQAGAAGPGVPPPAELAPAALRLAPVAARLRRGPYQVLYHGGWVQGAEPEGRAPATALPAAAAQAGVGGTITLYRERFLHALVAVGLLEPDGTLAPAATLRQGRRLKGTATHYFDGPALGVILSARPAAPVPGTPPAG